MRIIYEIKEINTKTGYTKSIIFDSMDDCLSALKTFLFVDSTTDVNFYRYEVETRKQHL